jgi:rhodanese-related sulfurtransferase
MRTRTRKTPVKSHIVNIFSSTYPIVLILSLVAFVWCSQANGQNYCLDSRFEKTVNHYLYFTVPVISVEKLRENRDQFILLDTRDREEHLVSTIPGAVFWDGEITEESDLPGGISRDQPIVVFCSIGYRSEKAGEKLMEAGFTNVRNLYGSIFEWANRNYTLVDALDKPTRDLHVYNQLWSRWVTNERIRKIW